MIILTHVFRTLHEQSGWTNREERVYKEFMNKYLKRISDVFKCTALRKDTPEILNAKAKRLKLIIEELRELMERRYYVRTFNYLANLNNF